MTDLLNVPLAVLACEVDGYTLPEIVSWLDVLKEYAETACDELPEIIYREMRFMWLNRFRRALHLRAWGSDDYLNWDSNFGFGDAGYGSLDDARS